MRLARLSDTQMAVETVQPSNPVIQADEVFGLVESLLIGADELEQNGIETVP